jgi:deoxyribodipyrimidine photolyase
VSALQFQISRVAADALDLETIATRAANAVGTPHESLIYCATTTDEGRIRIRCQERMALFLLEQLRALIRDADARGDSLLLAESAAASAAIGAALDAAEKGTSA